MRFLVLLTVLLAWPAAAEDSIASQGEFAISGKITGVVSGSDIIVSGKSVHLEGTRSPKRSRICLRNGESVDIGSEVADGLAQKLVGSQATMSVHTDENGRFTGSGSINGQDIGEIAITNGFAVTKIGDFKYAAQERVARSNRPGLWSCSSFPKIQSASSEPTVVTPDAKPLPSPEEIKPRPSPKTRTAIEYMPKDQTLRPQPREQEDDFELVLDDVGGFFENIFSGIDRAIRDVFGAPPN